MFTQSGNVPAKLIKEFRRKHDKPVLKGAYVQESVYVGDNMLDALISIKTKQELMVILSCFCSHLPKTLYQCPSIRWN